MLQTNLIGRQFETNISSTRYTVVAVYITSGNLVIVGENDKGQLIQQNPGQVTLIETPGGADEDLTGIV
jgi:hypothetical protein